MRQTWLFFAAVSLFLTLSSKAWAGIDIQSWQTSLGSKVVFVESPELPMLDVEVTFDAGSSRDGEHYGLASFTSLIFASQTHQMTEQQLSDALNDIGASISSSAGRDSASISLRTLTRPEILEKAVSLFHHSIVDTDFAPNIIARQKKRRIVGLKRKTTQPSSLSSDALWQQLYPNHPYGHATSGTVEQVEKFDADQLQKFFDQYYVTRNATISLVGAITRAEAEDIAEKILKGLAKGEKPAPISAPKPLVMEKQEIIDFNSTQTHYKLAQIGVERGHPDYVALFVGNHLLGGSGFGSLLMEELREKRGLTYGVYSYFMPMAVPGPFLISLSTKNKNAFKADDLVKDTLKQFMAEISQEKFDDIKENLLGGFPLRYASNASKIGYISMIGYRDLPLDYLDWMPKQIEQVTKQQVLAAWQKHIQPEKMLTLMVGRPK